MGRVRQDIKVDGRMCWTLFDIAARNTYVTRAVAEALQTSQMPQPVRTALGGSLPW